MANTGWGKGALQVLGDISFGAASRDCILEDLTAALLGPMGRFESAAHLDAAQHGEKFGRRNLANRACAKPRKNISLKAFQNFVRM
ncbi:hypothetical protein ASC93_28215 [Massilia sp. Root335]|nr:hypothetical protein ASC93_28215 [Massilia sp. Root335]